jgi:phosphoglycolate phosphatase-like HAD superfamily hydrolase
VTEESEERRYVESIRESIRDVAGKEPRVVTPRFAGMVDPQICEILLTEMGLNKEKVDYFLPRVLARMGEVYRKMEKKVALNDGVLGILGILATSPGFVLGVLTGNLKTVAEEKLMITGIRTYFSDLFCADHYFDRARLVEDAVQTCLKKYELNSRAAVLIIGDTPRDIAAANAAKATSIGIASGVFSKKQLTEGKASQVYSSLEPTQELLIGLGVKRVPKN